MKFVTKIFKFLVYGLCCFIFLISVGCLNSEGTTWGNSTAFVGFLLIIPSFWGMLKIHFGKFSRRLNCFVGLVAIAYTAFCYIEAQQKILTYANSNRMYWAPEIGYQIFVIILSLFLILPIVKKFLKSEKPKGEAQ